MSTTTKSLLYITLLVFSSTVAHAQNRPEVGTVGITASLQADQTNIKVPIWASEKLVIAPIISLNLYG